MGSVTTSAPCFNATDEVLSRVILIVSNLSKYLILFCQVINKSEIIIFSGVKILRYLVTEELNPIFILTLVN